MACFPTWQNIKPASGLYGVVIFWLKNVFFQGHWFIIKAKHKRNKMTNKLISQTLQVSEQLNWCHVFTSINHRWIMLIGASIAWLNWIRMKKITVFLLYMPPHLRLVIHFHYQKWQVVIDFKINVALHSNCSAQ